jgi:D-serine deaminase-like pyridoxal phosphate-dependent protein
MILNDSWYGIKNMNKVDTPALVVYPEQVKKNIQLAIGMAGGPERLRPHVKTNKSPDACRLMLQAGIRQFKCATIAEAEMLAVCGADDVLLAYQPIGPKTVRIAALVKKYPGTRFSCLIDNHKAAAGIAQVFTAHGLEMPVYLDLDTGMGRTGISVENAYELYKYALEIRGIIPVGLHAYDGHIRDVEFEERWNRCEAAFSSVKLLQQTIEKRKEKLLGLNQQQPDAAPDLQIVAGGSPTFSVHCRREGIQSSPGTFIYWDKGYEIYKEMPFSPAALVLTRVISQNGSRLTLDLGHKSIAAENALERRVSFLNRVIGNAPSFFSGSGMQEFSGSSFIKQKHVQVRPREIQFVSQSEEHLVIDAGPGHGYQIGDVLYGVPYHICPTVALYERALTVEEGEVKGEWMNSARDRKLSV